MKKQIQKVDSILKDLKEMHEFLGGGSLKSDYAAQNTEINEIFTIFRQQIFAIRNTQKERDHKEQKLGKVSPELTRLNFEIREGIKKCEDMLLVAEKRAIRNKKFKQLSEQQRKNIKKKLDNCATILLDVKQSEEGGVYKPPQAISLEALKVELLRQRKDREDSDRQSIDVEELQAFEQFDKKDQEIDKKLDEIIEVNERIKAGAIEAGAAIEEIGKKVSKITKKVDSTQERLNKTQDRLLEVLKTYRRPNKFCLDITLIIMLLGLIAVIVNMATKKS